MVETRPTLETVTYSVILSYQTSDIPAATIMKPVEELFPNRVEEFVKQYREKKGSLYEAWKKKRLELIKQDMEERRSRMPERVLV